MPEDWPKASPTSSRQNYKKQGIKNEGTFTAPRRYPQQSTKVPSTAVEGTFIKKGCLIVIILFQYYFAADGFFAVLDGIDIHTLGQTIEAH